MRERLIAIIEEVTAASNFDEAKYNEFYELFNKLKASPGLLGVAADCMTEYYACCGGNKKRIPAPDLEEAVELRENLGLLAKALRRNVTSFKSFDELRSLLERKGLEPDSRDGQQS
jgi:hypothetical protein